MAYGAIAENLVDRIMRTGESLWCDDVRTPEIREDFQDNIRKAFQATVDTLTAQFGPDPVAWKWGDLHKVALIHPWGKCPSWKSFFKVNRESLSPSVAGPTVCPYSYPKGVDFIANRRIGTAHFQHGRLGCFP
ncbi:MAG: penicillin acylase family protein [Bacteroidales bacterium]